MNDFGQWTGSRLFNYFLNLFAIVAVKFLKPKNWDPRYVDLCYNYKIEYILLYSYIVYNLMLLSQADDILINFWLRTSAKTWAGYGIVIIIEYCSICMITIPNSSEVIMFSVYLKMLYGCHVYPLGAWRLLEICFFLMWLVMDSIKKLNIYQI